MNNRYPYINYLVAELVKGPLRLIRHMEYRIIGADGVRAG